MFTIFGINKLFTLMKAKTWQLTLNILTENQLKKQQNYRKDFKI